MYVFFWNWSLLKNLHILHSQNFRWNPNMMVWTCCFLCEKWVFSSVTASSNLWEGTVGQDVSFCDGNIFLVYQIIKLLGFVQCDSFTFYQVVIPIKSPFLELFFLQTNKQLGYAGYVTSTKRPPVLKHAEFWQRSQWRTKTGSGGFFRKSCTNENWRNDSQSYQS